VNLKPDYDEMYTYVKARMADNDIEATSITRFPFRRRSEHTWRVYKWAECLLSQPGLPAAPERDALLTAALFHDVGYAIMEKMSAHNEHARYSAQIFDQYVVDKKFIAEQHPLISFLIRHHSQKVRMRQLETPIELVLLMEADLMDETGAMSMVWDCLNVGSREDPSYRKAYEHLREYSGAFLKKNPMVTPLAREIWTRKQDLIRLFIDALAGDLWIDQAGHCIPS